jgi:hypothetical protein
LVNSRYRPSLKHEGDSGETNLLANSYLVERLHTFGVINLEIYIIDCVVHKYLAPFFHSHTVPTLLAVPGFLSSSTFRLNCSTR